jgi:hypothetical protein
MLNLTRLREMTFAQWRATSKFANRRIFLHVALGMIVLAVLATSLILRPLRVSIAQEKAAEQYSEASSLYEADRVGIPDAVKSETAPPESAINSPEGSSCAWASSTVYPQTILDQATVVQGNTLYTFGGVSTAIIANAYKFDGSVWTPIAPLPAALEFPSAVSDGTFIYILGGALVGTGTPQTTVYRYDPVANTYTPMAPFTTGTWNQATVYRSGKIYKFAGTGPATASTNVLEIYDVATNTWSAGAPYPLSISFVGAFVQGNFIYGAGGIQSVGSAASAKTYRYDPVANTWDDAAITDLPQTRWGAASSITGYGVNNGWVLAGGYVNGSVTANISNTVIRWNPMTNVWDTLTSKIGERSRMTGGILGGSFYVVGGRSIASPAFVGTNSNQRLTCVSGVAVVTAGAATVTSGNNLLEPNECNTLNVPLSNIGDVNATAVSAVLSSTTPGITVNQANSAYPDIPGPGGPVNNTTAYQVSVAGTVACFTSADFTLTVTYTGGSSPATFNFSLPVGIPATNYDFTTGTGGTIPAGGTLVAGSQTDDGAVTVALPAGWNSTVYGIPVTSLSASTNGMLTVNGAASTTFTNTALLGAVGGTNPTLFPAWDDYNMATTATTNGGIFSNTVGSAPNREFYIEWRAAHFDEADPSPVSNNFAVKLTEGSDVVQYIHVLTGVAPNNNGASATVGIQRSSAAGSPFTQAGFNTAGTITPGMVRTGARPAGQCTPGSGTCGGPTARTPFDFDGDHKTDVSIFRPSAGEWWWRRSVDLVVAAATFGASTDVVVAADYTGDGKTDLAFFRPSTSSWFILRSEDGSFYSFPFGSSGDIPMPADYDGDGKADAAVYRPSNSLWVILQSSNGQAVFTTFGTTGDQPVAADYDGDGKADVGIFRPSGGSGGEWWIQRSTAGLLALSFGSSTDKAVPGDYTGDGKADVAFFRPSTNSWFVLRSDDFSFYSFPWGSSGDIPTPGDYDGDGKIDAAVFRPSAQTWFLLGSTSGAQFVGFGLPTDFPVPNAYVRN